MAGLLKLARNIANAKPGRELETALGAASCAAVVDGWVDLMNDPAAIGLTGHLGAVLNAWEGFEASPLFREALGALRVYVATLPSFLDGEG